MAKYKVEVVVTGIVTVYVEAENAQNAKDSAFTAVDHISFGSLSKINTYIGCVEDENHRDVTFKRPSDRYGRNRGVYKPYIHNEEEF